VRGYGGKVDSLDDLPSGVLDQFAKQTPQILDTDNWKTFITEASPPE